MAVGNEDKQSYTIAYERIRKTYSELARKSNERFHTETGKRFFGERMMFLREFLNNLEFELGLGLEN